MPQTKAVDSIVSRGELAEFIKALRDDLANHPEEWENVTLDRFLEALAAWVEDMDGYYSGIGAPVPSAPTWRTIAEMLLAAKVYE